MDNKQLLDEFKALIEYGSGKLQQSKIDFKKIRGKKKLLYFMMGVTQSYSASIVKLLTPPHIYDKSAEIIFRSLFENLINMSFVYTDRSNKNVMTFAIQGYLDKIKFANKYKDFMNKYPMWNLQFNTEIKTVADWDKFISIQKQHIKKIEKKYKFAAPKKYPSLLDRAIEHDKELMKKGKLNSANSLEFLYIYYYQHFSEPAHLNSSGIDRFIVEVENKTRVDIDAPLEKITPVLSVSYIFYFIFLKSYLTQFKMYKREEFDQFDKTRKQILSKNRGGSVQ
jgi:hypothetical protein